MNPLLKVCARVLLALVVTEAAVSGQAVKEVAVTKIWDKAEHNAFTDLIRFKEIFYCSFREGSGHVPGTDGIVRILKSTDGKSWQSVAMLGKVGVDLRDPKLSVTPDGRLMVIIGGSYYENGKLMGRHPHVSFSDKSGSTFSEPEKVSVDPSIASWGSWYWRVTWHKGVGYAMDYQIGPQERRGPSAMYLVKTKDGINFEKVSKLEIDGFPNEATIRFDKAGKMHVMIRREIEDKMGVWATSKAPFTQWSFQKMGIRLGGPNFLFMKDGRVIAGTRVYEPKIYTALFSGKPGGEMQQIFTFPSGGDNSYPGLVMYDRKLWVSYYSSHEGKTGIYLAVISPEDLDVALKKP